MMSIASTSLLLVALWAGCCLAEEVRFQGCPAPAEGAPPPAACTVHQVRISPCAEAAEDLPCKIKRGKSASIQFDFTPDVASANVTAQAFWTTSLTDLPFVGMNTDACAFTECPLVPQRNQSYVYELAISKKFPVRTYDVKWRLFNENDLECCFITKIKLVK